MLSLLQETGSTTTPPPLHAGFSRTGKHSADVTGGYASAAAIGGAPGMQRRGGTWQFGLQANGFRSAHGMWQPAVAPPPAPRGQRPNFLPDGVAMLLCDVTLGVPGQVVAGMRKAADGCHCCTSGPPGQAIHAVYDNNQARLFVCRPDTQQREHGAL